MVLPIGQLQKYVIQLAFPREGCAGSKVECEGLLAGLRIAVEMDVSRPSIRDDSQLMAGQSEGVKLNPLMKVYAGEVRKLADSREATFKARERRESVSDVLLFRRKKRENIDEGISTRK
jgi:ribonuclease HI